MAWLLSRAWVWRSSFFILPSFHFLLRRLAGVGFCFAFVFGVWPVGFLA